LSFLLPQEPDIYSPLAAAASSSKRSKRGEGILEGLRSTGLSPSMAWGSTPYFDPSPWKRMAHHIAMHGWQIYTICGGESAHPSSPSTGLTRAGPVRQDAEWGLTQDRLIERKMSKELAFPGFAHHY
jgi:hypothetical protein